ncbi:MAG: ABC transporter substrate-binding protein, partial [Gammaproteobacteria bacterium]|nr:ABC transporter substrate-binding protein [Gammaproteobacteria bacterium]MDX2462095.1 ABC transporter substrate-binding protein [Gammaproteobacteria bacterium]
MSRNPSIFVAWLLLSAIASSSSHGSPWNDPYPAERGLANTLYGSFAERPKHLDPARSYSEDEYRFIAQIYEPPLQYHFLNRPYQLVPLSLQAMPQVTWVAADGKPLSQDADPASVAFSDYEFTIQPGIRFQPHPALARDSNGGYAYHGLDRETIAGLDDLGDLPEGGTRELLAEDFVNGIKRIADPAVHSPIAGVMKQYIVGLEALSAEIGRLRAGEARKSYIDLRPLSLAGVTVLGPYRYRIRINGVYPQFLFWQAMPFFAPVPWEADRFYGQPGLDAKNISLDWYPIGTGPFYLTENNPNLRMVLTRNPHFHGEAYPDTGESNDASTGLLDDAGAALPFVDAAQYSLEKESIPRWNKFLQGFYDSSGIGSDSFDQAVQFGSGGDAALTDEMVERGIALSTAVATSMFYMGFNMLDPVVGGESERARLVRRAISIAVDFEEFVSIFLNGRGVAAQGPVPPGIFGHVQGKAGMNYFVYDWVGGGVKRKSIDEARALMEKAGYVDGRDTASGNPLVLYFEALSRGPDDKARLTWMRKQFDKLGVQLVVRATDYNRFREKMLKGTGQIYMWGWNADYPDPENFLFLLYGPNSKVDAQGENASNYRNESFDALFRRMKDMVNSDARLAIIEEMLTIARRDAPWAWGFYPKKF